MMCLVCILITRYIATQIANDALIFIVIQFYMLRQIIQFHSFLTIWAEDTCVVLFHMCVQIVLCIEAFNAFRFRAFEWHYQMDFFSVAIKLVFGQKWYITYLAPEKYKRLNKGCYIFLVRFLC